MNGDSLRGPRWSVVCTACFMVAKPPMPEPMIGGGAIALGIACRAPSRLRDGLVRGSQRELDEAVHPLVVFVADDAVGIEAAFGILVDRRHDAGNLRGDVMDEIVRQPPNAGSAGEEPLPDHARATTEWRNDAAAGDDNPSHYAPAARWWITARTANAAGMDDDRP